MRRIRRISLSLFALLFILGCSRNVPQENTVEECQPNYDAVLEYFLPAEIAQKKDNTLFFDAYAVFAYKTTGIVYLYYQYKLIEEGTLQNPVIVHDESLPLAVTFNDKGKVESYRIPSENEIKEEFTGINFPSDVRQTTEELIARKIENKQIENND